LAKLGAPEFSQANLSTLPSHTFTHREREIIALLKSKSPQSATIDELGDLLFAKNPDVYSPAAIAKAIQRIRDKLEHNGISGSLIQAHRGTGYLLLT
jgi:DNA-binding response OmpR family regulator